MNEGRTPWGATVTGLLLVGALVSGKVAAWLVLALAVLFIYFVANAIWKVRRRRKIRRESYRG